MTEKGKTKKELLLEIEELQARLNETEAVLSAIQRGEVDAIVGPASEGHQVPIPGHCQAVKGREVDGRKGV